MKKENSLVGRKVKAIDNNIGIYNQVGTIVQEYGNGVVVEWDKYTTELGYGDEFKTVLVFKANTNKEEFETNEPFVSGYTLA